MNLNCFRHFVFFLTFCGSLIFSSSVNAQTEIAPEVISSMQVDITISAGQPRITISGDQSEIPAEKLQIAENFISRKIATTTFLQGLSAEIKLQNNQAQALIDLFKSLAMLSDSEGLALLESSWNNFSRAFVDQSISDGQQRVIIGKEFHIDAEEKLGDVVVVGSSGVIEGEVTNLVTIASIIELTGTAQITKQLVVLGSQINKSSGAVIKADEVNVLFPAATGIRDLFRKVSDSLTFTWTDNMKWALWSFILALVVGLVYLRFLPNFNERTVRYLSEQTFYSFVIGFLGELFFFPTAIMLIVTIIGILFLPIYVALFALVWALGYIVSAQFLVAQLPFMAKLNKTKALVVGLVLIGAIRLIPYVGFTLMLLIVTGGFGSVLRSVVFGARRN